MLFEVVVWLWFVLVGIFGFEVDVKVIWCFVVNCVEEIVGKVHFVMSWSDGAHLILYSVRCVDGFLLEVMIGDIFKSDLILKVVRGFFVHWKKGWWGNM